MLITTNHQIPGRHGRPITLDITCVQDGSLKPVIIFAHGFKGFKDWGHWSLIATAFARKGYVFIKFNFSFNGTTPDQPVDFADLEAFGLNNYSIELDDVDAVINWLFEEGVNHLKEEADLGKLAMAGHSRSGPITIIKSYADDRIKAAVTWASVHSLAYAWSSEAFISEWKNDGVYHILNGRTGQKMPMYFQIYEDYLANKEKYDLEYLKGKFKKPLLILHGKADPGVPYAAAERLKSWFPEGRLKLIEGGDHVFGGRHPFNENQLPGHSVQLVNETASFLDSLWN